MVVYSSLVTQCNPLLMIQIEPNVGWFNRIEEVDCDSFKNIEAKLFPGVGLRDDVLADSLSNVAAICFPCDIKDQFAH